ncbi:ScbA/BarX family gamma-butyrolactone biosynthesis protein [Kitasatospora sp. MAA4]|uniref:ScbA/BarX family gamma-butyrolactone biosynthesis protein n=1 Tax=Kitasatospora sp. MAA4 TaxID=3035093 RepID=UPI002476F8A2|nr:ScbA/BarX family gamma-butyrolactone biosynthesis protein [Kitasatospora sp. MAA4]
MVEKIPKELVHLRVEDSVLITGWTRHDDTRCSLTAVWPADASPGRDGRPDSLLIPQTIRQSGLALAHAEFGAPLTHQTLLEQFDYTVDPHYRLTAGEPAAVEVEAVCTEAGRRGHTLTGLRIEMTIRQGGQVVARSDSRFSWISPAVFRRLRGDYAVITGWGEWPLPGPVLPRVAGRTAAQEIVLSPTGRAHRWQLRCDAGNPALFDHPVDHVPGLVLIEAAHQAANARTSGMFTPASVTTAFSRYVEFDAPCWIEATVLPTEQPGIVSVEVSGHQQGEVAFRSTLTGPLNEG